MITTEKVTVSLPKEIVDTLRKEIPRRKRSKFIAETVKKTSLRRWKKQALIKVYKEADTEIEKENQEFDGVIGEQFGL